MKLKVVTRHGIINYQGDALAQVGAELFQYPLANEEELISVASNADAVITGPFEPYTRKVIKSLTKCKVISRAGIGYNNIDVEAATDFGIPVSFIPDAMISEVSDHTIALILAFSRKLFPIKGAIDNGAWQQGKIMPLVKPIYSLSQQTLGLFGLGRIGLAVCKKALALDMRVIVYDPHIDPGVINTAGAQTANFSQLLAESDYLSLHTPLTDETKHAFGTDQFKKMKPSAVVINTARGALINENDLIKALADNLIAGAGLDVTDPEPPLLANPLLKMPNVILTAHTAFYSERSMAELTRRAVEAVIAVLNDKWPVHLANPAVKNSPLCRLSK